MGRKINLKIIAQECLESGVQYGHSAKEWNPKMAEFILREKYGLHIFDLAKILRAIKNAGNTLENTSKLGAKILFVGTDKISAPLVQKYALKTKNYYINYRWLGGMLTNWTTIRKQVEELKILEEQKKNGGFTILSKKQASSVSKKLEKLQKLFQGIKGMKKFPKFVIFTNQLKDSLAIQECRKLGIPTICIVDSNCDPSIIPYPIPANDDSRASINTILKFLYFKIKEGRKLYLKKRKIKLEK